MECNRSGKDFLGLPVTTQGGGGNILSTVGVRGTVAEIGSVLWYGLYSYLCPRRQHGAPPKMFISHAEPRLGRLCPSASGHVVHALKAATSKFSTGIKFQAVSSVPVKFSFAIV